MAAEMAGADEPDRAVPAWPGDVLDVVRLREELHHVVDGVLRELSLESVPCRGLVGRWKGLRELSKASVIAVGISET